MTTDITTLKDLSVIGPEPSGSVVEKLNLCTTSAGSDRLRKNLSTPLPSMEKIILTQQTIRAVENALDKWPAIITNGTIMVIEKFFESQLDPVPQKINPLAAYFYKSLHKPDFSLASYSLTHCLDFAEGLTEINSLFDKPEQPRPLKDILARISHLLENTSLPDAIQRRRAGQLTSAGQLKLVRFIIYEFRSEMKELLELHAQLDAWCGMAKAVRKFSLSFPEFKQTPAPVIEAKGLYHLLLETPVPYDISLDREKHFIFLTGANMAGKSTFIKSIGAALFLAHTGMAVPAKELRLSFFEGIISNINVADDISKGESYFFNEVQRIKSTIEKIKAGSNWLVLIDEIFKGTNIQDAMKCSLTVIEGLARVRNSLFILSTHLHELSDSLSGIPGITFSYFETEVKNEKLSFSYRLRDGVSRDRLGYLILEKEGVVKLLQEIS